MNLNKPRVVIVGGGLAGVEASYQCLRVGLAVTLYEMRPHTKTNAHETSDLAELVCSNSFKSYDPGSAPGLLKTEMMGLDSLVIDSAFKSKVEAGSALAVDRKQFSELILNRLSGFKNFTLVREEVSVLPSLEELDLRNEYWIIATGPLTSVSMISQLNLIFRSDDRHFFYDAIAPILDSETIDFSKGFWGNRWGLDSEIGDYFNIPLEKAEYNQFIESVKQSVKVPLHDFEDIKYFESCLPIEVMIERGDQTLRFGPLKPIGFVNPATGKRPWAIVQLRKENRSGSMLSMVGFQTKMSWTDQRMVFQRLPGLEKVEFYRLGSIHRNTYFECPKLLNEDLSLKNNSRMYLAGQMTGVEGYVESAGSGLIAGINAARMALGQELLYFPHETALGAMARYITHTDAKNFQPMNVNFGIFPELGERIKSKPERAERHANRALESIQNFINTQVI